MKEREVNRKEKEKEKERWRVGRGAAEDDTFGSFDKSCPQTRSASGDPLAAENMV